MLSNVVMYILCLLSNTICSMFEMLNFSETFQFYSSMKQNILALWEAINLKCLTRIDISTCMLIRVYMFLYHEINMNLFQKCCI